jgi:hypothetical protein
MEQEIGGRREREKGGGGRKEEGYLSAVVEKDPEPSLMERIRGRVSLPLPF